MIVVGLSHKNAPIEVRERLALRDAALDAVLDRLCAIDGIAEAMVLSTCNRVEVYAMPGEPASGARSIERSIVELLTDVAGREVAPHLQAKHGRAAVEHLFRVASSLESLVLGEPQILGQVKEAIRVAETAGTMGPRLSATTKAAVQVAKRVRTETAIGAGQVSVPTVAVDLARQIFEDLAGHTALLVGAGEMAEAAAKLLAGAGAHLLVVNRSLERAEGLAKAVGGRERPWEQLDLTLVEADIVVTSTAATQPIITHPQLKGLRRARRGRMLFLIDIAVPRDVDPTVNELDNVYLYDIDDLSHVVAQTLEGRAGEARQAEAIVDEEVRAFEERAAQRGLTPVIVGLRRRTQEILASELDRSLKGRLKHLSDTDRDALTRMLDAAVNKLMHTPTSQLKQAARSPRAQDYVDTLCALFELEPTVSEAPPPLDAGEHVSATEPSPEQTGPDSSRRRKVAAQ